MTSDQKPTARLTEEERERRLGALVAADRLRDEIAAKYGVLPVDSAELIHEMREERIYQIMRAIEGREE